MIRSAEFKCSSERVGQIPSDKWEFAFVGRSNVGKSSLVNMLTRRQGLAKVSGRPGKTRLINHFAINGEWYLVDLPGYGYARVSKGAREGFSKLVTDYIIRSSRLVMLFVLVDSRLEPQKIDLEFIRMLGRGGVPFGIIFTKCDKLSQNKTDSNVALFQKTLLEEWEELPPVFLTSSQTGAGRDEVLEFIGSCLSDMSGTQFTVDR